MSILTVVTPMGNVSLSIADDTLVFDGLAFVEPEVADYVLLREIPVAALSLAFQWDSVELMTSCSIRAAVIAFNGQSEPVTDPKVVSASDPALGLCVCGVTCMGTEISYVKVYNEVT